MYRLLLLVLSGALLSTVPAAAATMPIVTEEFMVPSDTPGIQLYVRNKHPRGRSTYPDENIILLLHGSIAAGEAVYDYPLGGLSWMDYIAERGYDVYLMDVRGYGRSSKPPEMARPATANSPIVRSDAWLRDLSTVVDFIKQHRKATKIDLLGWSAGTVAVGAYTAAHNDSVVKLVQWAPQWTRNGTSPFAPSPTTLGAYRMTDSAAAASGIFIGAPERARATLVPAGWLDQWAQANFGNGVPSPNGIFADGVEYWNIGKPYYDASKIAVPTMIVHGEWDGVLPFAMTAAYWSQLTSAPYKRWVEIGEATHQIFIEKNRMQMFREVQTFLDDAYKPES